LNRPQTYGPRAESRPASAARPWGLLLLYGALSVAFCLPLFEQPLGLGVSDWDRQLFYYGSVIRSAVHGQLPFWNPWSCGGTVLWQHPEVSLVSPAYALAAMMPLALAIKVTVVLYYVAGFAGMHLLLRRIVRLSALPVVACLASLFAFSSSFSRQLAEGHADVLPAFLLPLLLYAFLRGSAGSVRHTVLGGPLFAACLLGGALETALVAAVLLVAIAVVDIVARRTLKPAFAAACVLTLGLALAAPKALPTALFVTNGDVVGVGTVQRLLLQLPSFSELAEAGRFGMVVPLLAALAIGRALQAAGLDGAPRVARRLIAGGCLIALAQLGFSNSAPLRGAFSRPPLGIEERLYQRAGTLQITAAPTPGRDGDLPMFRSLLEGVSAVNCDEPFHLARVATPEWPLLFGDGPVTFFESSFSPNRMLARVVVGRSPGRVILNQSYSPGWSSTTGPVVRDAGGHPSVVVSPGFAGPVVFTFAPPGLWPGLLVLVVAVVLSVLARRHAAALEHVASRADQAVTRRAAAVAERVDIPQVVALLLAAGAFAWVYSHYPYRPTTPDNGWWNYWDQGLYRRSARAFARGVLAGSEHWYPIGYPLLAAPFVRAFADPFLPINFLGFVTFAWLCYRLFRPVLGGWGVLVPLFLPLFHPAQIDVQPAVSYPLLSQFAVPWNSNPIAPAYLAVLLGVRANWNRENRALDVALGALFGLAAATRPVDATLLGLVLGAYSAWAVLGRGQWVVPALVGVGTLVCVLPLLAFMEHAYGSLQSPYVITSRAIGFSLSDLPDRIYQILLRSEETYGEPHSALFQLQPWLHVALPLAVAWAWRAPRTGALPVGLALSSWVVYLAYNDLSPFNFLRFFLVHYIVWTLPVLACAGVAGAVCIVREKRWATGTIILIVALGSATVRLTTVPVRDASLTTEPAAGGLRYVLGFPSREAIDAIDVVGVSHGNAILLSTLNVNVTTDDRPLGVPSGYQVLRRPDGLRIIFNRHIAPRRVTFTLDSTLSRDPTRAPNAQPLRFAPTFVRP
jgi:hypothetical protein